MDSKTHLESVDEVLEVLGPTAKVMELTKTEHYQTVYNWRMRKRFPPELCVTMNGALKDRGFTADPSLWGQRALPADYQPEPATAEAPLS